MKSIMKSIISILYSGDICMNYASIPSVNIEYEIGYYVHCQVALISDLERCVRETGEIKREIMRAFNC